MSKPPLPEAAVAMLRKPNPAVITTLRQDGQPVSTATWYVWDDGPVLMNMDEGRKRLEHMPNDPRVVLDALNDSDWYTHVSVTGHGEETREDTAASPQERCGSQVGYTGTTLCNHPGPAPPQRTGRRVIPPTTVRHSHEVPARRAAPDPVTGPQEQPSRREGDRAADLATSGRGG
jgi:PPOX class probable F420-dependent enzyme